MKLTGLRHGPLLEGFWRRYVQLRGLFGKALQTLIQWAQPYYDAYRERVQMFQGVGEDPGGPTVTFDYKGSSVTYGVVQSDTGRYWMDRNVGASRAATSVDDTQAYGDLFQWGRDADGHQVTTSDATGVRSDTDTPGHDEFIIGSYDWRTTPNNDLWQYEATGQTVENLDFAPAGWRLPTQEEAQEEIDSWDSQNISGAYASPLNWCTSGRRNFDDAALVEQGNALYGWTSTPLLSGDQDRSWVYIAGPTTAYRTALPRAYGHSVRLIKAQVDVEGEIIDETKTLDTFTWFKDLWDNLVFAISTHAGIFKNNILGVDHIQVAFDMSQHDNDAVQVTANDQPRLLSYGMEFGTGEYLDAGTAASLDLGTGDFTIAGVFWPPATKTADNTILSRGDTDAGDWAIKVLNSDNTLCFVSNHWQVVKSVAGYNCGERWFAVVRDGIDARLVTDDRTGGTGYFGYNGKCLNLDWDNTQTTPAMTVTVIDNADTAWFDFDTSVAMVVGAVNEAQYMDGVLDNIFVIKEALSDARLEQLKDDMFARFWVYMNWDNTQTTPAMGVHDGLKINLGWDNTQTDPAINVT